MATYNEDSYTSKGVGNAGDDGKPLEFNRDGSVRKRPGVHREKPGKRMRRRKRKD